MLVMDHKKISVVEEAPTETTHIQIERSDKKSEYKTEAIQAVLRPCFENNKIGQPISISYNLAEDLLRASEEYNNIESIAWNANYAVFKYYEQSLQISEEAKKEYASQLSNALEEGELVIKKCAKLFEYLNEKVEINEGKMPSQILVFSNDGVSSKHYELNNLIERDWEHSKLKRRLIDTKKALERIPSSTVNLLKEQKRTAQI